MLYLFCVLDRYMADTRVKRQNPTITFKMHEIYNELIKDLLHVPGSQSHYLELGEHAEKGTFVKVIKKISMISTLCTLLFAKLCV